MMFAIISRFGCKIGSNHSLLLSCLIRMLYVVAERGEGNLLHPRFIEHISAQCLNESLPECIGFFPVCFFRLVLLFRCAINWPAMTHVEFSFPFLSLSFSLSFLSLFLSLLSLSLFLSSFSHCIQAEKGALHGRGKTSTPISIFKSSVACWNFLFLTSRDVQRLYFC